MADCGPNCEETLRDKVLEAIRSREAGSTS